MESPRDPHHPGLRDRPLPAALPPLHVVGEDPHGRDHGASLPGLRRRPLRLVQRRAGVQERGHRPGRRGERPGDGGHHAAEEPAVLRVGGVADHRQHHADHLQSRCQGAAGERVQGVHQEDG